MAEQTFASCKKDRDSAWLRAVLRTGGSRGMILWMCRHDHASKKAAIVCATAEQERRNARG